jgi:hypothetical protein
VRDGKAWLEIETALPARVALGARFPGGESVYQLTTSGIRRIRGND